MRWAHSAACVVAAATICTTARAEPSAAEIAVARKLFREATIHEKKEEWAEAEVKLRQAVAIKETPGLRYHLAFVQEQQGKLVEALVDYDRASELVAGGAKAPDVKRLLDPAREGVRKRVPHLTVNMPEGVDGASLKIDGKKVAPALIGQPVPLNPGKHSIEVTAPGRVDFQAELSLEEGEKRGVQVQLPNRPEAPAAPPPTVPTTQVEPAADEAPSSGLAKPIVLISEGVVTAGFLGLGLAFTFKRKDAEDRIQVAETELNDVGADDTTCSNPGMFADSCRRLAQARQDKLDAKTPLVVGYVGAGVGAAATVLTALLWRPGEANSAQARPFSTPTRGGFVSGVVGRF